MLSVYIYLKNMPGRQLCKLDFQNAFNSICCEKVVIAVEEKGPELLHFVHCVYSSPSALFIVIQSVERLQQGDRLGPLSFFLTMQHIISELKAEFRVLYMDNVSFRSGIDDTREDLRIIESMASQVGLKFNRGKSQVICNDSDPANYFLSIAADL